MCQLPPDSHCAMRSHIAALARLMPAPDVLPALRGLLLDDDDDDVAAGRALVPTFTTAPTGLRVTFCDTTVVLVSLPSTQVFWRTTTLLPFLPGVTTLVWPLYSEESLCLVVAYPTASVLRSFLMTTRLRTTFMPSSSAVGIAGDTTSSSFLVTPSSASRPKTVELVEVTVRVLPSATKVTFFGVVTARVRPPRPSGWEREEI